MSVTLSAAQALEVVVRAVALVCEVDPASLEVGTSLVDDLAADSVSLVEIIDVTEELLRARGSSFVFDDSKLADLMTVGDIVSYISAVADASGRTMAAA